MWSYYGSKKKIAYIYPKPIYDDIIEHFCGAAQYSLLHFEKNVTLVDKNPMVISIWEYLQHTATISILTINLYKLIIKCRFKNDE